MKSLSLAAVTLSASVFLVGCHGDEMIGEQLMSLAESEQAIASQAYDSLDKLVEANPTAAGNEPVPLWKTLSYSESLADAYAERIRVPGEPERQFD